jgi:hypothetical protein
LKKRKKKSCPRPTSIENTSTSNKITKIVTKIIVETTWSNKVEERKEKRKGYLLEDADDK